ncbi:anticodon-binding protein [Mycena leptocephala]|nr:anticodon-binding protein [Mycena leptocephala]
MSSTRFEPSSIKNKIKREEVSRKTKKAKGQQKLQKRLALAKAEANDPAAKKKRLAENVPRTLDNTREFDPSFLTADPGQSSSAQEETAQDIASDPFASYFSSTDDPTIPPKILITTSPKATKATFDFCDELVGVFPGRNSSGGRKARASRTGYKHMCVVNEDHKKPNAITLVHLPDGPTAYFRLTSVELTKQIYGHARATPHDPELVLNNFVTRLGHAVGRMFQTLFPPLPEFQGRQVVTLHNQRDFLFFRRHRYAFRSPEKVALQEIGPRFTLRLQSLRKGIPAVQRFGDEPKPLIFEPEDAETEDAETKTASAPKVVPELETTRRTFFL